MSRVLFLIIIGLGGAAILVSLGVWQVQRLAWKESVIADIQTSITADPQALPSDPDPTTDAYLPVMAKGVLGDQTIRVLVSQKDVGAGYRLISALETGSGRVLLDRGFVPVDQKEIRTPEGQLTVVGNLQWPKETDRFTPEPDIDNNIWFAREVPALASTLVTRPILIVARSMSGDDPAVTPLPVDTSRIPNDHLQYAITWFSLAAIWLAMTTLFLRRRRGQPAES